MHALITLSHGSRHAHAQRGVENLTAASASELGTEGVAAHLEFTSPDLTAAAHVVANAGYRSAVVVPLLFTRAFHATHDVPEACEAARQATGLELHLAQGLGLGSDLLEILARRLHYQCPPLATVILYPVGTSSVVATENIKELGRALAAASGRTVIVVPATGTGPRIGNKGIAEVARGHKQVHLVPLFVTAGVLLDRAISAIGTIENQTGATITHSPALTTDLSNIVTTRYREAITSLHFTE